MLRKKRKGWARLTIGDKQFEEIQILTEENELICSITDASVIEKDGYKVVYVPANN